MIRDITIKAVANGYIVSVGCQTFVFKDTGDMLGEVGKYLADPEGTEKRYRSEQPNMRFTLTRTPVDPAPPTAELQGV